MSAILDNRMPTLRTATDSQVKSSPHARARKSQTSMLDELFTPNGFWAPGIKVFRSVGFRIKALIITTLFSIPIAALMWAFVGAKQDIIVFAEQERKGVEYVRELVPLLQAAQRVRMASVNAAAGGVLPEADAYRAAYSALQQKVVAIDGKLGDALSTAEAYKTYIEKSSAAEKATGNVETVFAAHSARIDGILALIDAVTDSSNLALDPDLDSYYMMVASVANGPRAIEAFARLRGLGSSILVMGEISQTMRIELAEQYALAKYLSENVEHSLAKVIKSRPDLIPQVKNDELKSLNQTFLNKVNSTFNGVEVVRIDRAEYMAMANKLIDMSYDFDTRALGVLDTLLTERIASTKHDLNMKIAMVCVCLLLVAYMLRAFHMVTKGGMREVKRHLHAIAAGDLTTEPRAWGNDEAARLMETLQTMQHSLRNLVSQVRTSSDAIFSTSAEVADGTLDLSGRTEQAAANLEESAAAVEQISATIRNTAQSVSDAAAIANANSEVATKGGKVIGDVVHTMDAISTSSKKISDIIGVIDSIAFQTNILALNAAVEAARAGEQGRGFAVVASEVRNLAQRSAAAAHEIKSLITSSVEQVESGSAVVKGAGDTILEIVSNAERIKALLSEIATGAKEQATGMSQVGQGVSELDRTTQENAALVEQSAAAATSLKQQAQALSASVSVFKLP